MLSGFSRTIRAGHRLAAAAILAALVLVAMQPDNARAQVVGPVITSPVSGAVVGGLFTVRGTGVPNTNLTIRVTRSDGVGVTPSVVLVNATGVWSKNVLSPNASLPGGFDVQASQGTAPELLSNVVHVSTNAPPPVITSPLPGAVVGATFVVSGTGLVGVTNMVVEVASPGMATQASVPVAPDGTWTKTFTSPVPIPVGGFDIYATQRASGGLNFPSSASSNVVHVMPPVAACAAGTYSATGNTPCTPAAVGFYVPTAGATAQIACPAGMTSTAGAVACFPIPAPVITSPVANATVNEGFRVSGTAQVNGVVTLRILAGGSTVATYSPTNTSGSWSIIVNIPFSPTGLDLSATQVVPGGPTESAASVVHVSHIPPPPVITSPPSGTVVGDFFLVSGTGLPGGEIAITAAGALTEYTPIELDGRWSITLSSPAGHPVGGFDVQARQRARFTPPQSNYSEMSNVIHVSNYAPPPTITSPANGATVTGSFVVTGLGQPGDAILLYVNGTSVGGPTTVPAGGVWSTTLQAPAAPSFHLAAGEVSPLSLTLVSFGPTIQLLTPPPVTFALTLVQQGTGQGTVTSTPAGIDCGGTCTATFNSGVTVTLAATPDVTSTFTGWSGACSGIDPCIVTMDAARSVTATFGTAVPPKPVVDLSIAKAATASVALGGNITYSITVNNPSPVAVSGVTVTDALPPSVQFVSGSSGAVVCTHDGALTGGLVTCPGILIPAAGPGGGYAPITIIAKAMTSGIAVNNVSIADAASVTDPNPANNQASASTMVMDPPPASPTFLHPIRTAFPSAPFTSCVQGIYRGTVSPDVNSAQLPEYWFVKARATGVLNLAVNAFAVNTVDEIGTLTGTLTDLGGTPVGAPVTVTYPTGGGASPGDFNTGVISASVTAGQTYRLTLVRNAITGVGMRPAHHYTLGFTGAAVDAGVNSPFVFEGGTQDIHVNVGASGAISLTLTEPVSPAPPGVANISLGIYSGFTNLFTLPVTSTGSPIGVNLSGLAPGDYLVALSSDQHFTMTNNSVDDPGIYFDGCGGVPQAPKGKITVVKTAVGGDGTFNFQTSGGALPPNFPITTVAGTGTAAFTAPAGQYAVSEMPLDPGWRLDSLTCTAGATVSGPTATVTLVGGDEVTCTFVNRLNRRPVAADDSATTSESAPVIIAVLGNDTDPDDDTLAVTTTSAPAHGTVTINPDGTLTYTPSSNYSGPDSFTYTISDGKGGTATALVSVAVTPVNDPPAAVNDTASTTGTTPVVINVLTNDSDGDGSSLTVTSATPGASGTTTVGVGGVTYTANAGFVGTDTFIYVITDGSGATASAQVTVTVAAGASCKDRDGRGDERDERDGRDRKKDGKSGDDDDDDKRRDKKSVKNLSSGRDDDDDRDCGKNDPRMTGGGTIVQAAPASKPSKDDSSKRDNDRSRNDDDKSKRDDDKSKKDQGKQLEWSWGFELRCDGSKGNLEYQDHKDGTFKLTSIATVACTNDPAVGAGVPAADFDTMLMTGVGRWNGAAGHLIEVKLVDAGEPGTRDSIVLTVKTAAGVVVSQVSGNLSGGNHQAHK